ncbi:MAG: soluble lytic murein transglycosylase [Alphaproteobacteria bacterium]|nr:soluble lytic murein transglycosylase [Alphaproteobacteria bacterium]
MASRILAERLGIRALWPITVVSLAVLVTQAAAAPEAAPVVVAQAGPAKADKKSKSDVEAKTKTETKAGAKSEAKAKPEAKPKVEAKPKIEAKPKSEAKPKIGAKPKSEKETKAAQKPQKEKSAAKLASKGATAKAAGTLAPPVAAALKPVLPREESGAPAVDPVPAAATQPQGLPAPANTIITAAAIDVSAVKRAIEMVRNRKQADASEIRKNISDPAAKKLVEWVILRSDDSGADFARYVAFIATNPNWPSIVTLRRKAEATAFQEQPSNAQVQAYFSQYPPLSAKGRFALARVMLASGNRKDAEALVREAWRYDSFSQEVENRVVEAFGNVLTSADHKARMDRRLYEKDDTEAGVRAAARLGGNEPLIAKARIEMLAKGGNKATLDAVPAEGRNDIGYKFARIQMLRRADQLGEAVALIKTIPQLDRSHDLDEWWIERRVLARKLLDDGNPKDAYAVVRDATPPDSGNYRSEHQFMAGWIALRYLQDPGTAYAHFAKIAESAENPISLARGAYWTGRAAEALHRPQEAKQRYLEAARYPTAYYGQIARARVGLGELALTPFPVLSSADRNKAMSSDLVRAAELLYAVEARDLAWTMMADLGDKSTDVGVLAIMSELTVKYRDARGMLLLGKLALARGYALEHAAFPTIGVPDYTSIGPPVDSALVYAIVRQESWFNPKTVSTANALGLMQVTPAAGKYVAGKFRATFDQKRLLSDQAYNVQLGSAELGDVIKDYRGSYIMAFAAYNAGRSRVKDWVAKYGDPRDPKVDPIDWVERIPFSETRNYVQRVMENVQVYRLRFGGTSRLLIEADLRRGSETN